MKSRKRQQKRPAIRVVAVLCFRLAPDLCSNLDSFVAGGFRCFVILRTYV